MTNVQPVVTQPRDPPLPCPPDWAPLMIEFDRIMYAMGCRDENEMRRCALPRTSADLVFRVPDPQRGFVTFKRFYAVSRQDYWDNWMKSLNI
jgi:hypothetical protein